MRQEVTRYMKKSLRNLVETFQPLLTPRQEKAFPAKALDWIRSNCLPGGGIRVYHGHLRGYPEVSGYLIPTLLQYGETGVAGELVRWLMCIQRGDGSFYDPDGMRPHVFDTGQVLRGLLAGKDLATGALESAERAAEYLCGQMVEEGRGGFGKQYDGTIPESVHLYVLPAMYQASEVLGKAKYRECAERSLEYYCTADDFLRRGDLTHFLAYELEALIDLGRSDLAGPVLDYLRREQRPEGAVRGKEGAEWVCSPGLAQLAICWYKAGQWAPGDQALAWLEKHQRPGGGFWGSYGKDASYFPKQELSWAVKFYLDAHRRRVISFIDRNAERFPAEVSETDGRVRAILEKVGSGNRVVEVGCGKGRFLKTIRAVFPENGYAGTDISKVLLREVPDGIETIEGPMEKISFPDDSFDVVFSVEAIEHSANPRAAIREMIRIAKPGGWVMVIDKEARHWGRFRCPSWERWPEMGELKHLLCEGCDEVTVDAVDYDGNGDGLMMAWRGRKRSKLTGSQWNNVLLDKNAEAGIVSRIRGHEIWPWGQEIILATSPGQRVLEIGSGTGEISLMLAMAGRRVTIMDIHGASLEFVRNCAAKLGVEIETICGDANAPFPNLKDGVFDCVWSSGLLEHFRFEERRSMLREWSRISSGRVVAVVPNAGCLAYRIGKLLQEREGRWAYGLETPLGTLREEFEGAGLRVEVEYSVGSGKALNFLPSDHPLRVALTGLLDEKSQAELNEMNQGYLLITKGLKRG
jgi:malonyl-CoA O-methyltransferase